MDEHESWAEFWSFVRTPLDNLNNFSGSETLMISMTFYIWIDECGLRCDCLVSEVVSSGRRLHPCYSLAGYSNNMWECIVGGTGMFDSDESDVDDLFMVKRDALSQATRPMTLSTARCAPSRAIVLVHFGRLGCSDLNSDRSPPLPL